MRFFRLIFLVSFSMVNRSAWHIKIRPFAPLLCKYMCEQIGLCKYIFYDRNKLLCILSHEDGYREADVVWLEQKQTAPTKPGAGYCIVRTKSGCMVLAPCHHWFKAVTDEKHTESSSPTGSHLPTEPRSCSFLAKCPSWIYKKSCKVLSLTASRSLRDTHYMLVNCRTSSRCYRFLGFLNIRTHKVHGKAFELCERHEGQRDIFSGSCHLNRSKHCLYSTNTAFYTSLTSYFEPTPDSTKVELELRTANTGLRYRNLFCSFYQIYEMICILSNGIAKIEIRSKVGGYGLVMTSVTKFKRLMPGVKDFEVMDSSTNPKALIALKSGLKMVKITENFNFTLLDATRNDCNLISVTSSNGSLTYITRTLDKPVYFFHYTLFKSCFCKLED